MESQFSKLKKDIKECRECAHTFGFEPRPVFFGKENSLIMQVSQAPSKDAHISGRPFNDASGKRLIEEWYRIPYEDFYDPSNFYISAVAHCFPGKDNKGNDTKPPRHCADKWLLKELKIIKSKVIVLIGRHSAAYFFPHRGFTKLIFNDQSIGGRLAIVMPHPSPLNNRWLKAHPDFLEKRLPEIRKIIHNTLYC